MRTWSSEKNVDLHFIEPGKPNQNASVESFNGRTTLSDLGLAHRSQRKSTSCQARRLDPGRVHTANFEHQQLTVRAGQLNRAMSTRPPMKGLDFQSTRRSRSHDARAADANTTAIMSATTGPEMAVIDSLHAIQLRAGSRRGPSQRRQSSQVRTLNVLPALRHRWHHVRAR
jgi:transposase InsO family protein